MIEYAQNSPEWRRCHGVRPKLCALPVLVSLGDPDKDGPRQLRQLLSSSYLRPTVTTSPQDPDEAAGDAIGRGSDIFVSGRYIDGHAVSRSTVSLFQSGDGAQAAGRSSGTRRTVDLQDWVPAHAFRRGVATVVAAELLDEFAVNPGGLATVVAQWQAIVGVRAASGARWLPNSQAGGWAMTL